jgi:DNA polymerase III sliding clamp (beta) subunit (PCNA family)
MTVRLDTKIEEAATTDDTRPVLTCVHYDGEGHVTATDGYILAHVPAGAADNAPNSPGLIPLDAVKEAQRGVGRNEPLEFTLDDGTVSFPGKVGTVTADQGEGKFPDVEQILRDTPQPGDEGTFTFAINPDNLVRLAKALGDRGSKETFLALTVRVGEPDQCIGVNPVTGNYRGAVDRKRRGAAMPVYLRKEE